MDEEKRDLLLGKVRKASVRARDVSSGNPAGSHLNILGDAVGTLAQVVRSLVEEASADRQASAT